MFGQVLISKRKLIELENKADSFDIICDVFDEKFERGTKYHWQAKTGNKVENLCVKCAWVRYDEVDGNVEVVDSL